MYTNVVLQGMCTMDGEAKYKSVDVLGQGNFVSVGEGYGLESNVDEWSVGKGCYTLFGVNADRRDALQKIDCNLDYDTYRIQNAFWQEEVAPVTGSMVINCMEYHD